MKSFLITFLVPISLFAQNSNNTERLSLVVNNICEYQGQYVISNNSGSINNTASLGNAGCVYNSLYTHFDSLEAAGEIKFFEVSDFAPNPEVPKLIYAAGSTHILSFNSSFPSLFCDPVIVPRDTIITDVLVQLMTY